MLNLILGILWLAGAIGLLAYEYATGEMVRPIRGLGISMAWFGILLAAWNFARWYSSRVGREEEKARRIVQEAKLRQARHRDRPHEIDPTFDFSDKPPPPGPNFTDRGPSEN